MSRRWLVVILFLPFTFCLLPSRSEAARVEERNGLRVVWLAGAPYELGYQHGQLLKEEVRQSVRQVLGYFRGYVRIPLLGRLLVNWWLDHPWAQAMPFVPSDYLEELRGLSDGSGVPLRELWRLHAIPDRTYACSNFAAWGQATRGGRMIHARNLDWNIKAGIQRSATVFVVHPAGQHAFVNVGWAGMIGVLTGINDQQLSIGQVGAETVDATWRGLPMVFVMRKILERTATVDEAVGFLQEASRTVGVNYVIADAKASRAVAVETTHHRVSVFEANDDKERAVSYAKPMKDGVCRADTAIDPKIREWQLASKGDPKRPGLEPPGGSAYEKRYVGQVEGIQARYGHVDARDAREIAQAVAPDSNIQSVIFAWPQAWIANADGTTPAARTPYHDLNVKALLAEEP